MSKDSKCFFKEPEKYMNKNDFLDPDNPKIIKFVPEKQPTEIKVTFQIYKSFFPQDHDINFKSLQISNIGIYSIAKPDISRHICKLILKTTKSSNITITDALSNVGGMTIMFAKYFSKVNACEIVPMHCSILKNNLKVFKLSDKVNVICNDYMDIMFDLEQDVIFFDPPWGGRNYKHSNDMDLGINNVNIICIINRLLSHATYIVMRVPFNYNFNLLIKNCNAKIKIYKLLPSNQVLLFFKQNKKE
jgi:16S rRNA G966 N2-methylase RsmD